MIATTTNVQITEHTASLPKGVIHYYRAGHAGPPLVLLHGAGADTAYISWQRAMPILARYYQVYAPDFPKQGGSKKYAVYATQEALVACLRLLLDAWELQHCTLIGLSMGGSIAIGLTLEQPQRVDRLVLADSGGIQERVPQHRLSYLLLRVPLLDALTTRMMLNRAMIRYTLQKQLFKSDVADLDEIVDLVLAELADKRTSYSDWQTNDITWNGLKTRHLPRLHEITCPTLIIHGTLDSLVPIECARQAAQQLPNATLYEVAGSGHWSNREKPEEFNAVLLDWLRKTDALITHRT